MNEIIHTDVLKGLKTLNNNSVDIIIADPPYNISKDFVINKDNLPIDKYVEWSMLWIQECYRVLKNSGTFFIYGFPEIIQYLGVKLPYEQRWLFWHYTNKTVPSLKFWQRSCEVIISTWKDKSQRIFNLDDVREEYTDTFLKNAAGKKRKATIGRYSNGSKETIYKANEKGALPRDLIKIPALAGGAGAKERDVFCKTCNVLIENKEEHIGHSLIEHPTQKPLALSKKLIISSFNKEIKNTILIPFCGTGSEIIASLELGQNYISFENNIDYIHLAEKRIDKYFGRRVY